MRKEVLFIQGAGSGAYEVDKLLADNLQRELGSGFKVHYPAMPDEADAPYKKWKRHIEKELDAMSEPAILVGHSVGASILAKYLSEGRTRKHIAGIFLLGNPFWGSEGWTYEGYEKIELPKDAAERYPTGVPIFLYHTRDDEMVPFSHLALYAQLFPKASRRELETGGHQLNNDLSVVAKDIKSLQTVNGGSVI